MRVSSPKSVHCCGVDRPVCRFWGLMGHAIDDVVQPHAKSHRSEGLGIIWVVGPLPCVAQVHVVTDGYDYAAFIIADGTPLGLIAILLVGAAAPHILLARYLHFVIDVVERMED